MSRSDEAMSLSKKEKNALRELVREKVKALIDSYKPYPEIVIAFWLPLLKTLGGEL